MFEAVSEVTGKRLCGFFCEEELISSVNAESVPGDFWDVSNGNGIAYYYTPKEVTK